MGKRRRRGKGKSVHIGEVIHEVLADFRLKTGDGLMEIWDQWEGIVGSAIAENARPAAFKGKILLIQVSSSPWLHQLRFLKKDILGKINDHFGENRVEDIKFKIGSF